MEPFSELGSDVTIRDAVLKRCKISKREYSYILSQYYNNYKKRLPNNAHVYPPRLIPLLIPTCMVALNKINKIKLILKHFFTGTKFIIDPQKTTECQHAQKRRRCTQEMILKQSNVQNCAMLNIKTTTVTQIRRPTNMTLQEMVTRAERHLHKLIPAVPENTVY